VRTSFILQFTTQILCNIGNFWAKNYVTLVGRFSYNSSNVCYWSYANQNAIKLNALKLFDLKGNMTILKKVYVFFLGCRWIFHGGLLISYKHYQLLLTDTFWRTFHSRLKADRDSSNKTYDFLSDSNMEHKFSKLDKRWKKVNYRGEIFENLEFFEIITIVFEFFVPIYTTERFEISKISLPL